MLRREAVSSGDNIKDELHEMESASHPCVLCMSCSRDRVIVQGGRVNRFAGCCACKNADCNIIDVKYAFHWLWLPYC